MQLVFVLIRTASLNYIDELLGIRLDDYSGSHLKPGSRIRRPAADPRRDCAAIVSYPGDSGIDWEVDELEECVVRGSAT